jgi:hypothetical protein
MRYAYRKKTMAKSAAHSFGQAPQFNSTNAERNKLAAEDHAFHDWYRFVLSYPAHLVREYLADFGLKSGDTVLDPFCGTGTTVVEAKLQGIQSVGLEANRFAQFAGNAKVDWAINSRYLRDTGRRIHDAVVSRLKNHGMPDDPKDHPRIVRSGLQRLNDEQTKMILKNSISAIPLHKTLVLLDEIDRYVGVSVHKYLRLALAKAVVFRISNLKFGPEVGVGKAKEDIFVARAWLTEVEQMCDDLEAFDPTAYPEARVLLSDSRNIPNTLRRGEIGAVITSPPYPNEKDYTRTTRLESVLLGFVSDRSDLRSMKKTLLRSNTRGVYVGDDDDKYVEHIPEIQEIARQIETKRIQLGKTSGFERMYPRLTKLYFGGMAKHLIDLKAILKPGAMLAYVVGDQASYLRVMIRTGGLLSKIAADIGYEPIRIDQFRTRFSTATKEWLNEEVVVLRWPRR